MEISEYLGIIRRKLWILIAVPLAAALLAYLALGNRAQQWTSTVEVAVPTSAQNTAAGAVTVYLADFKTYLTSDPVINKVAQENPGVPRSSIKKGLSASEVSLSDLIKVTYTGRHKSLVEGVAKSAALATLAETSQPQVADAQAALQLAQLRYGQAQAAVQNFENTQSGGLPEDQYREKLANLDALKLAASQARLDLNIPKANGLDAQIPLAEAQIAALLPKVQQYQQLTSTEQEAGNAVTTAMEHLQDAQSQALAANNAPALNNAAPKKVNETKKSLTYVGIAAGIGLIVAILYIVFSELLATRRARRTVDVDLLEGTPMGGPDDADGRSTHGDEIPTASGSLQSR